jgi:hypothetical protein
MPDPCPPALAAVLGIASAAVASYSITGAAAIVAIVLAAAPVLWVVAVAVTLVADTRVAHHEWNVFPVLRLLLSRDPALEESWAQEDRIDSGLSAGWLTGRPQCRKDRAVPDPQRRVRAGTTGISFPGNAAPRVTRDERHDQGRVLRRVMSSRLAVRAAARS